MGYWKPVDPSDGSKAKSDEKAAPDGSGS